MSRSEQEVSDPTQKNVIRIKIEKSDERIQSLALLMLHYCAGLQHCMDCMEADRLRKEAQALDERCSAASTVKFDRQESPLDGADISTMKVISGSGNVERRDKDSEADYGNGVKKQQIEDSGSHVGAGNQQNLTGDHEEDSPDVNVKNNLENEGGRCEESCEQICVDQPVASQIYTNPEVKVIKKGQAKGEGHLTNVSTLQHL